MLVKGATDDTYDYFTHIFHGFFTGTWDHINGLMQERRNSSALAMELHLSCTNLPTSLPSAKEGILKNMGKIGWIITKRKHNKAQCVYIS